MPTVQRARRAGAPGWTGYARRIDAQMLGEVAAPLGTSLRAFICGPTLFVEAAAGGLVQRGIPLEQVRTERFGSTGSTS